MRRKFEKKGCACFVVSTSIVATGKVIKPSLKEGDACLVGRLVALRDRFSVFL